MKMPKRKQGFIEFPKEELTTQLNLTRKVIWETHWNFKHAENDEIKLLEGVCVIPTAANWIDNDGDNSTIGEVPIFAMLKNQQKLKLVAEMKFYLDFDSDEDPEASLRLQVEPNFTEAVLRAIAVEVEGARKQLK
jgi:hypothetical protein